MQTRSQTNNQLQIKNRVIYDVNINFDEASESWMENKKSIGNGSYKYICCCLTKSGKKCGIVCIQNQMYCKLHYKMFLRNSV